MIHTILTDESWSDDFPRRKIRLGGTIIYYQAVDGDARPIKNELEMMALAAHAGVSCPQVYSYICENGVELAMIEFVEGVLLKDLDVQYKNRAMTLRARDIKRMESVQQIGTNILGHPLFGAAPEKHANSKDFYLVLLDRVQKLAEIRKVPKPDFDPSQVLNLFPISEKAVLCHGDLKDGNNVIVNGDQITFIDWECAGFLPLHIARYVIGEIDGDSSLHSRLVRALCKSLKYGINYNAEEFSRGLEDLVEAIKEASSEDNA